MQAYVFDLIPVGVEEAHRAEAANAARSTATRPPLAGPEPPAAAGDGSATLSDAPAVVSSSSSVLGDERGRYVCALNELLWGLFSNDEVIKIGMDFTADLERMRNEFPLTLPAAQCHLENYHELKDAIKLIDYHEEDQRNANADTSASASADVSAGKPDATTASFQMDAPRQTAGGHGHGRGRGRGGRGRERGSAQGGRYVARNHESQRGGGAAAASSVATASSPAFRGSILSQKKIGGLARLVSYFLGADLSKTCQLSDWSRRPLFPAQLHYAALDAACMLPIDTYVQTFRKRILNAQEEESEEPQLLAQMNAFNVAQAADELHEDTESS